uniref:hypothetical protein n=1 Tax=Herbidospora sakaeratensis TaxID=564415 RepID=UPI0007859210|nr:hypothetical protein [Herbidospora sakaeratensis]
MALEETLRVVLAQTGTAPAALTKGFLAGLRTALADLPAGPGTADLAADLDAVLAEPTPEQPVAAVTVASPLREALLGLAERLAPGSTTPAHDEGRLWTAVHLNALRLSRREADLVRRAAEEIAVRSGARLGKPGAAVTLSGPKDERLIPALKVDGRAVAPGLAVSGGAPRGDGVVPAELAAFAAMVPVLAGLDPGLHHCLQALEFSGLRPLADPAARTGYVGHLHGRLEEVAGRQKHSGPWLESVVRLHEALCSVVHLPPAPEDSWWGEWRIACNDALSDAALDSGAGTVKFPPGRYRSVDDLTRHDIAIHYPERPGQVLACVRAWSSVHGIETPGRVIYAS